MEDNMPKPLTRVTSDKIIQILDIVGILDGVEDILEVTIDKIGSETALGRQLKMVIDRLVKVIDILTAK